MEDRDFTHDEGWGRNHLDDDKNDGLPPTWTVVLGLMGLVCKAAALVLAAVYWGWTGIAVVALYIWGEVALGVHTNAYEEAQRGQQARMRALLFATKITEMADGREILFDEDGFPVGFSEKEGDGE